MSWKEKAVSRSQGCIVFRFLVNVHLKKTTLRSDWLELITFVLVALFLSYFTNVHLEEVPGKVHSKKLVIFAFEQ